ncbi:MAG: ABC transporter permease [Proteobacteria bacterium]|nr:ABC transporter permease [Pseudomonadota bacterium]
MSQFTPVLTALRRHRGAALLIVCNVALCAAIVCNALHLAGLRLATMLAPSGWPEDTVLVLNVRAEDEPAQTQGATTQRDLTLLAALPGVRAAAIGNVVPWGDSKFRSSVTANDSPPTQPGVITPVAMQYRASAGFIETMDLRLVAGRDFTATERIRQRDLDYGEPGASPPAAILNAELARALFPHGSAVGQTVRTDGAHAIPVVGVVDGLRDPGPDPTPMAVLLPVTPDYGSGSYLLRIAPAQREAVAQAAVAALRAAEPRRSVGTPQLLAERRREAERDDRVMAAVFAGVVAALLAVTACGIVGLASFWVQQRTRMIGIRRALGATQADVRRYFQLENALLTGAGALLGLAGAQALSLVLKSHWEVPALPWPYLPLGALVLMLLGQAAVLAPARRAAGVAPMTALRS